MTNDQIINAAFPLGLTSDNRKIATSMLNWCRLHKAILERNIPRHCNMTDAVRVAIPKVSGMFYEDIISRGRKAEKIKWRYLLIALIYETDVVTQQAMSASIGYNRSTISYAIKTAYERKEWANDYKCLKEAVNEEINKQIHK